VHPPSLTYTTRHRYVNCTAGSINLCPILPLDFVANSLILYFISLLSHILYFLHYIMFIGFLTAFLYFSAVVVNTNCRGSGTYTAGTVNSVPLLTVAWKSVDFPRHFWWPESRPDVIKLIHKISTEHRVVHFLLQRSPKMHQISQIFVCIFQNFPKVTPPDPHNRSLDPPRRAPTVPLLRPLTRRQRVTWRIYWRQWLLLVHSTSGLLRTAHIMLHPYINVAFVKAWG